MQIPKSFSSRAGAGNHPGKLGHSLTNILNLNTGLANSY